MAAFRTFALALLPALLAAQEQAPEEPKSEFKVGVTEIAVPVAVFDHDDRIVNGLQPRQFRLLDNGKEQDIKVDVSYHPISLVIAVQSNANVEAVLPQIKKVGSLLESVVVGDQGEVAVMAFDHRLRVLQDFTNDTAKLSEAMKKMTPGSSSARMIDAVEESVRMLRRRPPNRRRFILLISETRDITSEAKSKNVLTAAQFANVTVYTVNISRMVTTVTAKQQPPRPDPRLPAAVPLPGGVVSTPHTIAQKTGGPGGAADFVPLLVEIFRDVKAIFISNHAEVFTKGTGGAEFSFVRQRGLEDAISRIGEEIHSQYMITYSPSNKLEGGFHEIKVLVDYPGAKPRTRPGYWLAAINQ